MSFARYYPTWWGSTGGGGGGGGGGSVTTVSVTTANGISGTVANPTTTPAITLTLGDITPTSVVTINGAVGTKVDVFKLSTGGGANTELLRIDGGLTTASEFTIKVLNTGTGVSRALSIYGGNGLWLESQSGNLTLNAASSLVFRASSATRFNLTSSALAPQTDNAMDIGGSGLQIKSLYLATSALLASSCTLGWNADTILLRDAAGSISQRNGTSGQRFRVYNTFTGSADEWAEIDWLTAVTKVRIGSNKSGSGVTRVVEIIVGGSAAAQWDSSNNFYPVTNNGPSCGLSSNRWSAMWAQTKVQIGASGADVILTGEASGILQLGQDSGTPAAQRIKAFDGSGTSIQGSNLELCGGQSTGNVVGGSVVFLGSPAGGVSNSSPNAYQTNLTITGAGDIQIPKTITAGGTTGNQTINKLQGSVNFAAAATALTVTNSFVTANSVIICTVATNDATMKSVNVVAGSGSFTINANAAATAETRVNFLVFN